MINITESASNRISELLEEEDPGTMLRIFVQGGGCAGFQYGFTFDDEKQEDDFLIEKEKFTLAVDSMSLQYLNEATIDYVEGLMGAAFKIANPAASSTCGCGSSFSI